jgi:hypothetical protein
MSDSDNDRKRKASEMDAAAVAPKKKLAAQAALAAAEAAEKDSAGSAKSSGSSSVSIKLEGGRPSYSVEESAPSGANAADSEEVLKFQNERLYAALEVTCWFCAGDEGCHHLACESFALFLTYVKLAGKKT